MLNGEQYIILYYAIPYRSVLRDLNGEHYIILYYAIPYYSVLRDLNGERTVSPRDAIRHSVFGIQRAFGGLGRLQLTGRSTLRLRLGRDAASQVPTDRLQLGLIRSYRGSS